MRNAIDQYTLDKEAAPNALDDLVSAGYLRDVPTDPITRQKDWNTASDEFVAKSRTNFRGHHRRSFNFR